MKKFALALTGMAAISAAPAVAETTYLSFSLDYSQIKFEEGLNSATFEKTTSAAAFERTSGKLTYGGELTAVRYKADFTLGSAEFNISEVSAYLGYDLTSAITVFASASIGDDDYEKVRTLTAGAEYTSGAYTFGAAYSTSEYEFGGEYDNNYVYVEYNANDLSAYGAVMFESGDEAYFAGISRDVEAYQVNLDFTNFLDLTIYELSGSYYIRDNLRLNGAVSRFDIDDDSGVTEVSLGAGYMVADNVWVDASYERSDIEDADISGFGLKVSYEMGKPGVRAADRVTTIGDIYELFPTISLGIL